MKNLPQLCESCAVTGLKSVNDFCIDKACCLHQQSIFRAGYMQALNDVQRVTGEQYPALPIRACLNSVLEIVRKAADS